MRSQGLRHGTLALAGHDLDEEGAFYVDVPDENFFSFQKVCKDAGHGTIGEVGVELRVARQYNGVQGCVPLV